MKRVFFLFLLVLMVLTSFSCKRNRTPEEEPVVEINTDSVFLSLDHEAVAKREKQADRFFTQLWKSGLNGVVLYAEQGQIVYEKAMGWKQVQRQRDSLHIDDAFQLSSDSKMFTAEAIMLLHAQGRLDYDDDICQYIPEFPYKGVTIRHLLNHRSGLPRYDSMADEFWPDRKKPFSNEALIKMLVERKPEPYGAPDATYFYNNINYALLASVVERVTGEHFEDFMKQNIFDPLGMSHSYIYSMRNMESVPFYMECDVPGHELYRSGAVKLQDDYLNGVMGDKIMFSTVDDIYKYSLALDCHLLLPDSLQQEAFRPGSPEWKHEENYGFGWRMSREHPDFLFHYGWWKGYRSVIIKNTVKNRLLVVLTNTTYNLPSEPMWEFVSDTSRQLPAVSFNPDVVRRNLLK